MKLHRRWCLVLMSVEYLVRKWEGSLRDDGRACAAAVEVKKIWGLFE